MGCGPRPATAITWFFENVERGIILEDDCVPHPTFFRFCEELLEYYNDNERVMHIGGNNFQYCRKRGNASYYFSTFTHNWGWATWRRAWKFYDFNATSAEARQHIWDFQWMKSMKRRNGLAVLPNVNLVAHLATDGTHGSVEASLIKKFARFSNIQLDEMKFPLSHPPKMVANHVADRYTQYSLIEGASTVWGVWKRYAQDVFMLDLVAPIVRIFIRLTRARK